MRTQPIALVDAFATRPFTGNPAGVCLLPSPVPAEWMQSIALEMNQAETAFLVRTQEGFDLRWFTPTKEVDLCGHATLASAHYLWQSGALAAGETARFHTRSGLLTARLLDGGWIELDLPSEAVAELPCPEGLAESLGAEPLFTGKNRMDYLVELAHEEDIRALRPDLRALSLLPARGVIVTAQAKHTSEGDWTADFISRCFYPQFGIDEDPVTGSAHCALAPYWSERLGNRQLTAYQASPRGGWLRLQCSGGRVLLRGMAVTTLRGELLIPAED